MVIAELSIYPLDKGVSLSEYVARAVKVIKNSGLDYILGPMGTSFEGEFEEVMEVIKKCFYELEKDCDRIAVYIKMDYRKGRQKGLTQKVKSVEDKL